MSTLKHSIYQNSNRWPKYITDSFSLTNVNTSLPNKVIDHGMGGWENSSLRERPGQVSGRHSSKQLIKIIRCLAACWDSLKTLSDWIVLHQMGLLIIIGEPLCLINRVSKLTATPALDINDLPNVNLRLNTQFYEYTITMLQHFSKYNQWFWIRFLHQLTRLVLQISYILPLCQFPYMYYTEIIYTSKMTQNLQFVLFCLFVCLLWSGSVMMHTLVM